MPTKIKIIINVVTLVVIAVAAWLVRAEIVEAWYHIQDIVWWLLALQILTQFLNGAMVAYFYQSFFYNTQAIAQKIKISELYKFALEMNLVNLVYPGGGIGSFSYVHLRFRGMGVKFADATLAHGLRFILTYVSFLLILFVGLILLAIDGRVNDLIILLGGIIFISVVVILGAFIYLVGSKKRIRAFVAWIPKLINYLTRLLHSKAPKELIKIKKVERVLDDIHTSYKKISSDWRVLSKPFIFALMTNVFEILAIYLIYIALGSPINPGAIILAYAVANLAGVIAVIPGGVGLYETWTVVVMQILGVSRAVSLPATLLHRVLKFVIFIPIGYLFYYDAVNKAKIAPSLRLQKRHKDPKAEKKKIQRQDKDKD